MKWSVNQLFLKLISFLRAHPSWQQERKVNMETFGVTGGMRRGGRGRGRGRGRGGYRGGRGGNRYQGHDGSSQGGRGGWRGGRGGSRGDRSRSYVDQPINGNDKLPRNLPNGPAMVGNCLGFCSEREI